jgi:serine/threonine-protein kinase
VTRSGLIFDDRYRLDERIAAGGIGQVWRGRDLLLQRPVAVKVLRPEYADHPEALERFRKEARHAGALNHPNVAQVYDYGHDPAEGSPYLVMELVDGPSLADVLAADPVEPAFALDVIAQTADGLSAAHQIGLVHRDIKPGNILIGADRRVKVTDFGISHAAGQTPVTSPGLVMGTTQYMAPERIAGGQGTPASDLYALGIMLHECLTGTPPFTGTAAEVMAAHLYLPLPALPTGVPPELDILVARLTAKDPTRRLRDARDVAGQAARLRDELLAGGPVPSARDAGHSADLPLLPHGSAQRGGPASAALELAAVPAPVADEAGQARPESGGWPESGSPESGSPESGRPESGLPESAWSAPDWSDSGWSDGDLTSPPGLSGATAVQPEAPEAEGASADAARPANGGEGGRAAHGRRRAVAAYAAGGVLLAVAAAGLLASGVLRPVPGADRTTVGTSATGAPAPGESSGTGSGSAAGNGAVPGGAAVTNARPQDATASAATTKTGSRPGPAKAGATPSGNARPSGPSPQPTSGAAASASQSPDQPGNPTASASGAPGSPGSPAGPPTGAPPTTAAPTSSSPAPTAPAASSPPPPIACVLGICL